MQAREMLIAIYCDWRNNYLTIEKFAEHHGITSKQAEDLILLACLVFESPHPES